MKTFELVNYNFDEQRIDFRVQYPLKDGYIIAKDIDLEATIYKMKLWNVQPDLYVFFQPTPKHGFDFGREDFGGFIFELIDEGVVLDRIILRFRYTNLYKYKQNINDFYHPSFVNYREFFVYDKYKDFDLSPDAIIARQIQLSVFLDQSISLASKVQEEVKTSEVQVEEVSSLEDDDCEACKL